MRVANAVEQSMDGTSGALYEMYLNSLSAALQDNDLGDEATIQAWSNAARVALGKLEAMTPARVGDRTIMDALVPFVESLAKGNMTEAVDAARKGCETTKGMTASLGRAVYVPDENYGMVPDPGAEGIVAIVEGLSRQLE
jgi:dihydroxyacetone kinase